MIFAKSLRVLDTTDRDRALEELDREREARRRLELDFAVVQVGMCAFTVDCEGAEWARCQSVGCRGVRYCVKLRQDVMQYAICMPFLAWLVSVFFCWEDVLHPFAGACTIFRDMFNHMKINKA